MSKSGLPFGGDVDIGWKLEVGATVTFVSATIVVTLRCLTRWNYSKTGWDDYIMVFALVSVPKLTFPSSLLSIQSSLKYVRSFKLLSPQSSISLLPIMDLVDIPSISLLHKL
jgi:hypothetical protein